MKRETATRLIALLLLVVLAAMLLPTLSIARYAAPQLDDITYGEDTSAAWRATGSVAAVFKAAAALSGEMYRIWQGTYTATFLMALQPGIWGAEYYGLSTLILIGMLLTGLWALCRSVGRHVLGLSGAERTILFALSAILCTQLPPSPAQAFYWFNGAVFYTFFFALALMFSALLIGFVFRRPGRKRNILYYVFLPIMAVVVAGGNYSTCLTLAMLLAALVAGEFICKKRNLLPLVVLLLFLGCFAANLLSPGNAQHQSQAGGLMTAVTAGVKAVGKAVCVIVDWTTLPAVCAALAMIPMARRFAGRSGFGFRLPLGITGLSVILLAAGFMPTLYTQNYTGSDRLLDIQYDLFVLLLLANAFYWTGWACRRVPVLLHTAPRAVCSTLTIAWLALACIGMAGSYDKLTAVQAAISLYNGEAASYAAEASARQAILEDGTVADVVFPPLENRPELLLITDYSADPNAWENVVVGNVYHKTSLRIAAEEP